MFEAVSDIEVRGNAQVALLRYVAQISVADAGGQADLRCWHTDCYEMRDGRWQAVWSQATVIAPGD